MASWKDNLRPASFRGIPFLVDTSQFSGGRRVVGHEFPDKDKPFPEDLGKAGSVFRIEGHLLGDDYFEKKKLLREAAEKYGPGELVHPYFGKMSVQCGPFSIDEDNKEGRYCKISFQFFEAGTKEFPKVSDDKLAILGDKAAAAKAAAKASFDKKFTVAQLPGFAADSAKNGLTKAMDTFTKATKSVRTTAEGIAALAYNIRNIKAQLNDLIQAPGKLSQRLMDSFDLLLASITGPKEQTKAFSAFFNFNSYTPSVFETPSRVAEAKNSNATDDFHKQVSVAYAAESMGNDTFTSVDDALAARNTLRDLIDKVLETTDDDDVFAAFKDLNAAVTTAIPDEDEDLPLIETRVIEETQCSLVLAYDFFGSTDGEQDLVDRNLIRHPGFILGGTELEVLNNG